jgi:KUP system potassium uptake protein
VGQIYVPTINWMLMLAAIAVVLEFGSSSNLAAAYGVAVTLNMAITTVLAYLVSRRLWKWSIALAGSVSALFLVPELVFVAANLAKVPDGGWFPLVLGAIIITIMTTWRRGRDLLGQRFREHLVPLEDFIEVMRVERPARVPGIAVFMTSSRIGAPPALLFNFLHNRVVHERVVLLTIVTEKTARVAEGERIEVEELTNGFRRVVARYGFMESPDVCVLLANRTLKEYELEYTTFFLGRETVLPTTRPGMAVWREHLFAFLTRNAQPATAFFGIPPSRVLEVGAQIEL